ncbi:MAG: hypothetical protein JSW08_02990 [archaeon]|nr:MAG: hypothetical protein JSW08_02990 [archaeon]
MNGRTTLGREQYEENMGASYKDVDKEIRRLFKDQGYDVETRSTNLAEMDHVSINPKSTVYRVYVVGPRVGRLPPPVVLRQMHNVQTMGGLERIEDEFPLQDSVLRVSTRHLSDPMLFHGRDQKVSAFPAYYGESDLFKRLGMQLIDFVPGKDLGERLKVISTEAAIVERERTIYDSLDPLLVLHRFLGLDERRAEIEKLLEGPIPRITPQTIKQKVLRHMEIIDPKFFELNNPTIEEMAESISQEFAPECSSYSTLIQADGRPKHNYGLTLIDPRVRLGPVSLALGYLLCNPDVGLTSKPKRGGDEGDNPVIHYLASYLDKERLLQERDGIRMEGMSNILQLQRNVLFGGVLQGLESLAGDKFYLGSTRRNKSQEEAYSYYKGRDKTFLKEHIETMKGLREPGKTDSSLEVTLKVLGRLLEEETNGI